MTMNSKEIYRGYDIEHHQTRGWLVSKDGEFVCAQPSHDFAMSFIDREVKKAAEQK